MATSPALSSRSCGTRITQSHRALLRSNSNQQTHLATRSSKTRTALKREGVIDAALALADDVGVHSLSMRKLGKALGVEAMSLYHHVANKDELLDAMVERVVGEFAVASATEDWRVSLTEASVSVQQAILRHPWSSALIEARTTPSDVRYRYNNSVLGALRRGGFQWQHAYVAMLTLDGYVYGFALQQVNWPFERGERAELIESFVPLVPEAEYPHLVGLMHHMLAADRASSATAENSYDAEFLAGLNAVLDGLARMRDSDVSRV
ncbi:MAG: AcrR family transcriptional regulator [Bradymonadia bacterium]|jgi:AcrR family transcriptional regulator